MNIRLVRASQFFRQLRLVVRHKPGKEHIILDALSRLANANDTFHNNEYLGLDSLFAYYTTLVEINTDLIKHILDGYAADSWWTRVHKQILDNKELGSDKAILLFVVADSLPSDSDPYFQARLEKSERVSHDSDINDSFLPTTGD